MTPATRKVLLKQNLIFEFNHSEFGHFFFVHLLDQFNQREVCVMRVMTLQIVLHRTIDQSCMATIAFKQNDNVLDALRQICPEFTMENAAFVGVTCQKMMNHSIIAVECHVTNAALIYHVIVKLVMVENVNDE